MAMRKFWAVVCDVKGCNCHGPVSRTRVAAKEAALKANFEDRYGKTFCGTHIRMHDERKEHARRLRDAAYAKLRGE
ncbi:hypothetical protein KHO57_gp029 [Mycobacterium phage Phabba]|uniref:Uncharacterized protein n=1 Tax=Mycobacterium phage Phabba TaxID=2027899 RepID=A0A249XTS3_9CAUD|nr:hypothetical protein KHO57_gp029 [Mycobacterium phage Phabba]ASZ74604.1 hypothetical protein SEA_PHABBA_29 [Mycobacterium phage Phabba]